MVNRQIHDLLQLPQHEQRSPEWFEKRKNKLTSSDAASILGTNPYSTEDELLLKKCGIEKPFIGNIATLHGQKYEDEAIELYCRILGKTNYNFGLIAYTDVNKGLKNYNPDCDFLAGSPDGIAECIHNPEDEAVLLEVKCPFRRKIIDGYIPEYYIPQVQLNLFICNLKIADFIEYCPKTSKLNIVRIYRDTKWLNKNIPLFMKFWKSVEYYRVHGLEECPAYINKILKDKLKEEKKIKQLQKQIEKNKRKVVEIDDNDNNNDTYCMGDDDKSTKYLFVD